MVKKSLPFVAAGIMYGLLVCFPTFAQTATSLPPLKDRFAQLSPYEQDEVLWLARCVYSESNLKHEQEVVAWVVRNRVETEYRGSSYREVVLEPLQFSAFNTPSPRRSHILSLTHKSTSAVWQQALDVALTVYQSDPINRPISLETRHFYSPISMKGGKTPPWAKHADAIDLADIDIDPNRFLFFEEIDESADPFLALEPAPQVHIDKFQEKTRARLQPTSQKTSIRERLKPTGRVKRPSRPRVKN